MHKNNGACSGCSAIFAKYPNFHEPLESWFHEVQRDFPEFHTSGAGRGKIQQEVYFNRGASRAHFGDSAHNWNIAFDSFLLVNGVYSLDEHWYLKNIAPRLPEYIEWYGRPEYKNEPGRFYERPHFEWKPWRLLRDKGMLKLVEDMNDAA